MLPSQLILSIPSVLLPLCASVCSWALQYPPPALADLTCASTERGGRVLLSSLTSFCNHVGDLAPECAQRIFFGATLISLTMKDGGIRPFAFDQTIHRLVSKCLSRWFAVTVGVDLVPFQLRCGVSLGCEAAAHAMCQYLQCILQDHLLKLDYKNAFNFLQRKKMLELYSCISRICLHSSILPMSAPPICSVVTTS